MPLRRWVYFAMRGGGSDLVALSLKVPIDYEQADGDPAKYLASLQDPDDLLNVVDAILQLRGPWPLVEGYDPSTERYRRGKAMMLKEIELILHSGSSFLRVNDEQDGLARRVDATVTAAFTSAVTAAANRADSGSAADQIRDAWGELYGVQPDPQAAYSAAIKAVESAAHAIVEPNNSRATLGTMIGVLKGAPHRYRLVLPGPSADHGIDALIKMMELIWTGQTSRHGAQTVTRAETEGEAEMAVHLAVTLVHWFSTGALERKS